MERLLLLMMRRLPGMESFLLAMKDRAPFQIGQHLVDRKLRAHCSSPSRNLAVNRQILHHGTLRCGRKGGIAAKKAMLR